MTTRPDRNPRLAVLIDADNASPRIAAGLFEEIAKIGEASVRRIYGDFSSSRSQGWADVLSRFAIIPHQQFAYVTGKNASDITLVIDAMDLLHSGRLDGFCLVSSDSDFTRLAARIREQGVDVFGFGEKKTPESFRQACRRFIYTENLLPERAAAERAGTARPLEQPETASDLLKRVIDQMDTEDGWVSLGTLGKQLAAVASDFDPRTFGFKKLSDLIRSTEIFEVDDAEPGRIRVRLKPSRNGRRPLAPAPAARPMAQTVPVGAAERRPVAQTPLGAAAAGAESTFSAAPASHEPQAALQTPADMRGAQGSLPPRVASIRRPDPPPDKQPPAPARAVANSTAAPDLRPGAASFAVPEGESARSGRGDAQVPGALPPPPAAEPAARAPVRKAAPAASEPASAAAVADQPDAAAPAARSRRGAGLTGASPRLPLSPAALVAHVTARDAAPPAAAPASRRRVRAADPSG